MELKNNQVLAVSAMKLIENNNVQLSENCTFFPRIKNKTYIQTLDKDSEKFAELFKNGEVQVQCNIEGLFYLSKILKTEKTFYEIEQTPDKELRDFLPEFTSETLNLIDIALSKKIRGDFQIDRLKIKNAIEFCRSFEQTKVRFYKILMNIVQNADFQPLAQEK